MNSSMKSYIGRGPKHRSFCPLEFGTWSMDVFWFTHMVNNVGDFIT